MATLNPKLPENSPKTQKKQLKLNYKLSGVRFSQLACQGEIRSSAPVSYVTGGYDILYLPVTESRDLVSVSRRVSRPIFWSLDPGLEGLRSRLGFEGFRSRSRALRLETLHRLFFMKFCKEFLKKRF